MMYNKIIEGSAKHPSNIKIINFKTSAVATSLAKNTLEASKVFQAYRMVKLTLKTKLLAVSISWDQIKSKIKANEFSREFEKQRTLLRECEELYEDKKNNLIGLTIFDSLMKKIKK